MKNTLAKIDGYSGVFRHRKTGNLHIRIRGTTVDQIRVDTDIEVDPLMTNDPRAAEALRKRIQWNLRNSFFDLDWAREQCRAQRSLLSGPPLDRSRRVPHVHEVIAEACTADAEHMSPRTLESRKYDLLAWNRELGHFKLDELTKREVEIAWATIRSKPTPGPKTKNRMLRTFRGVMASVHGTGEQSPLTRSLRPIPTAASEPRDALTVEQLTPVFRYLDDYDLTARRRYRGFVPFLWLMLTLGFRPRELDTLTWDRVDLTGSTSQVKVLQKGNRRVGKADYRTVDIAPAHARILQEHEDISAREMSAAMLESGLVFPSEAGKVSTRGSRFQRCWRPALDAAGLPHAHVLYDLRKANVSLGNALGIPIHVQQRIIGHTSSVGNTILQKAYLQASREQIQDAVGKLAEACIPCLPDRWRGAVVTSESEPEDGASFVENGADPRVPPPPRST